MRLDALLLAGYPPGRAARVSPFAGDDVQRSGELVEQLRTRAQEDGVAAALERFLRLGAKASRSPARA